MEWLTNLLGFANNGGSSPFGALGGSTSLTPPAAQPPAAAAPAAPATPPAAGGMQMPGLLGKLMGQQQPGQTGTGGGMGTNNTLLNQAFGLMKPAQIQQPQWMNLLSGPRG